MRERRRLVVVLGVRRRKVVVVVVMYCLATESQAVAAQIQAATGALTLSGQRLTLTLSTEKRTNYFL